MKAIIKILFYLPVYAFVLEQSTQDVVPVPTSQPADEPVHETVGPSTKTTDTCEGGSCYPVSGDLLIGRQHRLHASSTCGTLHPERYGVSAGNKTRQHFFCDSRKPNEPENRDRALSHRIQNVVQDGSNRLDTGKWWQSENGVQNVSIRLDLEAEFQFSELSITFKSRRSAAMLIERSSDFGATWRVYRYFAQDCAASFPIARRSKQKSRREVVCESRYSDVEPATMGEVLYRVFSPQVPVSDPYHPDIQELPRVTNIRINFTKLHRHDEANLPEHRNETVESQYYAIYQMVIRGSCQCYGHSNRCLPAFGDNQKSVISILDALEHGTASVGRCDCSHHTTGRNCEQCADLYNDLPWRPAYGREKSECKRCNCNNHALTCHFDRVAFEDSGFVSGGVCDDCQHNTMGNNCEQCKPQFYRTPGKDIKDPGACTPHNATVFA